MRVLKTAHLLVLFLWLAAPASADTCVAKVLAGLTGLTQPEDYLQVFRNHGKLERMVVSRSADLYRFVPSDPAEKRQVVKEYRNMEDRNEDFERLETLRAWGETESGIKVVKPSHDAPVEHSPLLILPYLEGRDVHAILRDELIPRAERDRIRALYEAAVEKLVKGMIDAGGHPLKPFWNPEGSRSLLFADRISDGTAVHSISFRGKFYYLKTDNMIFNPADNSLTLFDPY